MRLFTLGCLLFFLLTHPALAQFSSNLQGTVTDPSGAVIPNVTLLLTNPQTNQQSTTKSNGAGQYRFQSLAPGAYTLQVNDKGFQQQSIAVTLSTEATTGVDIHLSVGQSTNTVTVEAQGAGLNPEENRVQTTLSTEAVRTLPLQNRGTLNVLNAAPGVSGFSSNLDNFANETTPNASANGHFSGSNLYVIDGISSTSNVTGGTNNITPNPDSLQEIALQTNTFAPDFPNGAGVTVELTTKSGANKFHGAGEYSFYNQDLQAHSYFVPVTSPYKKMEYSGVFGGPIWRDRTFFFASVEKKASTSPASTGFFTTEDPTLLPLLQSRFRNTIGTKLLAQYPDVGVRYLSVQTYTTPDLTTQCTTPTGGCTVPFIDKASQTTSPYDNGLQYSLRLDQLFRGGKDRIYGYYFHIDHETQIINARPQFNSSNGTQSGLFHFDYSHVFSPNLVNEASFAYYRVYGDDGTALPSIPDISINNASSINGFGGGFGAGSFVQHNYSWRDVVTYVRGRHSLRFGVEVSHGNDTADFAAIYARPNFGFNSLADFVNDKPFSESNISYNPLNGAFKPVRYGTAATTIGAFAQDSWKVTPRLTVQLGIRWDDFGNPYAYGYPTYTSISNLLPAGSRTDLAAGGQIDAQFSNAAIRTTANVYNGRLNNNWAPRIGFSYAPTADGKMTIHGGVGYYFDPITLGQIVDQLRNNPPGWIYPQFGQQQAIPAIYGLGTTDTYPFGYTYPKIPATGLDARGGIPGANAGVQGIDPNIKTPPTLNYVLGVSQELAARMIASVSYTGSYSWNQLSNTDFNRSAGDLLRNNGQLKRLNPSFGAINYTGNFDEGRYDSVIFALQQQVGKLNYQASYTWSHARDYGTCDTRYVFNNGTDCPPDQHLIGVGYYGNSSFDEPNNFKLSGSYELPSPRQSALKEILGGWQVTSLTVFQSGVPFTAVNYAAYDAGCLTSNADNPVQCGDYNADGYNQDYPNVATNKRGGAFSRKQYIAGVFAKDTQSRTTDFTAPTPGTEGNEGRNTFRNPNLFDLDASVLKNTVIPWFYGEKSNLQLRVDAFNAINRTNLGTVNYDVSNPNFGQSTSTYQPRILQLGARFEF